MWALRAHRRGGPEMSVYEQAPRPTPKDDEVLVAVTAAAITFAELTWDLSWTTLDGEDRTPVIPSHEVSGIVAEVGSPACAVAVGDAVFGLLPFDRDGSAAEFVAAPASVLARRPRDDHAGRGRVVAAPGAHGLASPRRARRTAAGRACPRPRWRWRCRCLCGFSSPPLSEPRWSPRQPPTTPRSSRAAARRESSTTAERRSMSFFGPRRRGRHRRRLDPRPLVRRRAGGRKARHAERATVPGRGSPTGDRPSSSWSDRTATSSPTLARSWRTADYSQWSRETSALSAGREAFEIGPRSRNAGQDRPGRGRRAGLDGSAVILMPNVSHRTAHVQHPNQPASAL